MNFSDLIFHPNNEYFLKLAGDVKEYSYYVLGLMLNIAVIMEYFGGQRFDGIIKRLFISIFLIQMTDQFLPSIANFSLSAADHFINKYSKSSLIFEVWSKSSNDRAMGLMELGGIALKSFFSGGLLLCCYICLLGLGKIYTAIYGGVMVFAPLFAMLGILPNANKAHSTVGASLGFIFVTPIALSLMICIIHGIFTKHMAFDNTMLSTIDAQIDLLIFTFFLLSGMGVSALVFGSLGLGFGGDRLGQAFGQALVFKAMGAVLPQSAGVALKGGKLLMKQGKELNNFLGSKPLQNFGNKTIGEVSKSTGSLIKSGSKYMMGKKFTSATAPSSSEINKFTNLPNTVASQAGPSIIKSGLPSYKFKSEAPTRNSIAGKYSNHSINRNYSQGIPQRKSDGAGSYFNQNRNIERNISMERNYRNNIERIHSNRQRNEAQQMKKNFANYKPLKSKTGNVMIGVNNETPFTKNNNKA